MRAAAGTSPRTAPACAPARSAGRATGMPRRAGRRRSAARARGRSLAPRSKSAWAHSWSKACPVRSWTRSTLVSRGSTGAPKAKHAIASAVYAPTPGSSVRSSGQPDAATACAARCRLTARRLYPSPCQARITSARGAAASASTVGQRWSQCEVARHDARHLRLLQHDLRDEDRVRVARHPPGQIAPMLGVPVAEQLAHWHEPNDVSRARRRPGTRRRPMSSAGGASSGRAATRRPGGYR